MPLLAALGQVGPQVAADANAWEQFGPFAIVFILFSGIVVWLLRDRATTRSGYEKDIAAHIAQIDAYRKQLDALTDRLITTVERTTPILERAARALEGAGNR